MKMFCVVCTLLAFIVGLIAAYFWYKSSNVLATPIWPASNVLAGGLFEPVDPTLSQMGWTSGILRAAGESARLNQIASRFTAIAVVLSTLSSLSSVL